MRGIPKSFARKHAKLQLQAAVRRGDLDPACEHACEDCGLRAKAFYQADYSQPLNVRPLCLKCLRWRQSMSEWIKDNAKTPLRA